MCKMRSPPAWHSCATLTVAVHHPSIRSKALRMYNLGHTRSDRQPTHLLQTPDTFVGIPLPGFDSVTVIVHAAPAIGAAFTQYTAEFEPGGSLGPAHGQRFLYVLEGGVSVTLDGQPRNLGRAQF